jgi:t-SNARE complex subunit (syntaxin)
MFLRGAKSIVLTSEQYNRRQYASRKPETTEKEVKRAAERGEQLLTP